MFSEAARVFENYATTYIAAKTWINAMDIHQGEQDRLLNLLKEYYNERVIPVTLAGLGSTIGLKKEKHMSTSELLACFLETLDQMSPRQMLCEIGFTSTEIGFSTSFLKWCHDKMKEGLFRGNPTRRIYVLHPNSPTDWFKRDVLGTFKKKDAVMVKFQDIEPRVVAAIEAKLKILVPNGHFEWGNYVKILNNFFFNEKDTPKEKNCASTTSLSPALQELVKEADGLCQRDVQHLITIAKTFKTDHKRLERDDSGLASSPSKAPKTTPNSRTKARNARRQLFPRSQDLFQESDTE